MISKPRGYDGRFRRDGTPKALPQQLPENPENKLYIGNLHRAIGEAHIVKLFSRFGDLARVHFLWHKAGPMRGIPRGFCFVEFSTKEDAETARNALNGRPLKGRNLVIEWYRHRPEGVDLEEWPVTEAKERYLNKEAEIARCQTILDIKEKLVAMKDGVQDTLVAEVCSNSGKSKLLESSEAAKGVPLPKTKKEGLGNRADTKLELYHTKKTRTEGGRRRPDKRRAPEAEGNAREKRTLHTDNKRRRRQKDKRVRE